jgi:acetyl esterase/lipase
MIAPMRRAIGLGFLAFALGVSVLLWRWTHTPHGRLDLGAALVVHSMPSGPMEMTPETRRTANGWTQRFMGDADPSVAIADLAFPGPAGELPLRVYTPPGDGPFPVVAWIHGGGFWMGDDLPMWDGTCSRLAQKAGAIVASIGYRLAPEHPFRRGRDSSPASALAAHAGEWRGDASRLAVMGGAHGGNLAAVTGARPRRGGASLPGVIVPAVTAEDSAADSRRIFAAGYQLVASQHGGAYLPNAADRRAAWASPSPALRRAAARADPHRGVRPLRDRRDLRRSCAPRASSDLQRFGAIHGFLGSRGGAAAGAGGSRRRGAGPLREERMRFTDRVAVLTGPGRPPGARGRSLREEGRAWSPPTCREDTAQRPCGAARRPHLALGGDVSDVAAVSAASADREALRRVDVLVNNAGVDRLPGDGRRVMRAACNHRDADAGWRACSRST